MQVPALPQPRPSSGGSPSSRNRSVQRLRAAVSEIRQGWAEDGASPGSPFAGQQQQPRPMIIKMPLRSRTGGAANDSLSTPAGAASPSPGGGGHSPDTNGAAGLFGAGAALSPLPNSPFMFYTGDASPSAVAAMCRGARIVRAHGLRDSDDPLSTATLFGAYSPDGKRGGTANNSNNNSIGRNSKPPRRPGSAGSDVRSNNSARSAGGEKKKRNGENGEEDGADDDGEKSSIDTARLEKQTEDELIARTNELMSGDIRPLMDPRGVFFVPSLLNAGPLASQVVDEFTAGHARRKMLGVIQREAANNAALRALGKARGAVREHDKLLEKEREEAEKHGGGGAAAAALDETVTPGSAEASGPSRRKEKDPETLAKEAAIGAEAARVRGACELLESAKLEGTNHAALFTRLRRILSVGAAAGAGAGSGAAAGAARNEQFCIPTRRLLQLLVDLIDAGVGAGARGKGSSAAAAAASSAMLLPQWEVLAHRELQAQEAARVAREAKSYRRGGATAAAQAAAQMQQEKDKQQQQQQQQQQGIQPSASSGDAAEDDSEAAATATTTLERAASSSALKREQSGAVLAADVTNASFRSPSHAAGAMSSSMNSGGPSPFATAAVDQTQRPLPLYFPPLQDYCKAPQTGAALRSLAEEFVATLLDPQQLTVARVLQETGFAAGKTLAAIATASPGGDIAQCWQPPLRVVQVSRLVDGLQRCLTSTAANRKTTLVELVVTSAFNFMRAAVLHRAQWTAVCNSVEDMHAHVAAKAARAELQRLQRGRAGNNRHQTPTKGGGAASGSVARGRSPPSAATPPSLLSGAASPAANNSPSRCGGGAPASGAAISAITPVAALSSPASPSLGVHHSASRGAQHFFSDRDDDENEDDDLDGAASLSFLHRHHRHLSAEHQHDGGGVPRLALLSERPSDMSADFFELECIGYSEFTELQHVMLERRHFADAPDDESDAAQSFQLLRALSSCFSAAFRLVLQEQQLAAALAGSKRKKKKIDPSELPPVYPDKTTVLRFKDFRALFLANERIAGKLLPFILAAVVDQYGPVPGYSRWRVKAPLSAYL